MVSIPIKVLGNTPLNPLDYVEMIIRIILFFIFTAISIFAHAQESQKELVKSKEYELQQVRERINNLKGSMDRSTDEQEKVTGDLKRIEIGLSEKRLKIDKIEAKQRLAERKNKALNTDLINHKAYFNEQSSRLASQLRAAYMSGSQEKMKLLLNQRDPAMLGRLMVYYEYLNKHRVSNISAVMGEIKKINDLNIEISAEKLNLINLSKAWQKELDELNLSLKERQKLLKNLDKKISDEGLQVNQLLVQEKKLETLISDLTNILSDYSINLEESFINYNGRLDWPVNGKVIHDFGQPRVGGKINWNGVVFTAPRGSEVRAVHYGQIAFADWLAGLGLLVIIDHGDGFMTLYGYNETILKNTGDWVSPGDVIATVGDSGGQQQSSLYFELRKGAKPINPNDWVTKSFKN
tara:strand:+ start:1672 stop:2895 length:1224 start_codon:yes stop_codon:yes gene_type:complete